MDGLAGHAPEGEGRSQTPLGVDRFPAVDALRAALGFEGGARPRYPRLTLLRCTKLGKLDSEIADLHLAAAPPQVAVQTALCSFTPSLVIRVSRSDHVSGGNAVQANRRAARLASPPETGSAIAALVAVVV